MARNKTESAQFKLNYQIRARYVSLVDENNQLVGQHRTEDAIQLAKSQGKDLVEVNSNSNPPIAKICDYSKLLYEQKKKAKNAKKAQKLHTIQVHMGIEENDLNHKFRQLRKFIEDGDLVKFVLILIGREMAFKDQAFQFMHDCLEKLSDITCYDNKPKQSGRNIEVLLRKKVEKKIKQ